MGNLRERAAEAQATMREFVEIAPQRNGAAEPAPDVDASDVTADLTAPVHVAWSHVMADVQWIGKGRLAKPAEGQKGPRYNYRGIDDVLDAVGPALRKHGVFMIPVAVEPTWEKVNRSGGGIMTYCRATVTFTVFGPKGDQLPRDIVAVGEAFDTGDKSSIKAQTVAIRIAYINALAIPVNRPELDPEYGTQHELAAPPPPSAEDYHAEILRPATSLNRLRQILAEFGQHPDVAAAEVETETGERITLRNLLTRIGKERAATGGTE